MPVTFKQIAANTAHVTIKFENIGDVTVEYYPNKLTSKYVADLQAGAIDDNTLILDLIKSWDIYEDEDMTIMFPIERIDEFGYKFKMDIAMAIANDQRPEVPAPAMNGAH